jgi:hypothetical protein
MTTKLKAIVHDANKNAPVRLEVEKDIDGNVIADIHWVPSKLYPTIKIDSTYINGEEFYFENNTENFTQTRDTVINLELGQIKHNNYGFHELKNPINLGLSLPTPYDNELKMLEAQKPLPSTTVSDDGWIFTFFLSFQTTVTILILIILYIIGVVRAIARNSKLRFNANVTFFDSTRNQLGDVVRLRDIPGSTIMKFGTGGSPRCKVDDAEWQFIIQKKNGNPFLVFEKPRFIWKSTIKYVARGKKTSGDATGSLSLDCGLSRTEQTHRVTVKILDKK